KHAVQHASAGNDASCADDGIDRYAHAAALFGEDELRRRLLRGAGANGPTVVVQVEDRRHGDQVHVGIVESIERTDVAPVEHLLGVDVVKIVGYHAYTFEIPRDDVAAEIVTGIWILCVLMQKTQQDIGLENIDPHRRADHRRIENGALGIAVFRLLFEGGDAAILGDFKHAKTVGFLGVNANAGEGDVGVVLVVPVEHLAVIHLIDVV